MALWDSWATLALALSAGSSWAVVFEELVWAHPASVPAINNPTHSIALRMLHPV
jgi:hypothetical protein